MCRCIYYASCRFITTANRLLRSEWLSFPQKPGQTEHVETPELLCTAADAVYQICRLLMEMSRCCFAHQQGTVVKFRHGPLHAAGKTARRAADTTLSTFAVRCGWKTQDSGRYRKHVEHYYCQIGICCRYCQTTVKNEAALNSVCETANRFSYPNGQSAAYPGFT